MAGIRVDLNGPFFRLAERPLKEAMEAAVVDLRKEGEAKTKAQMHPGRGYISGDYQRSIHGLFVSSLHVVIANDNSTKGKILERGRYWKSTGHRFKGYYFFRNTARHLRRLARQMAGEKLRYALKRLT